MPFSSRIRSLIGLIAALAVLVTPALLFAHARLVRSTPATDARLGAPPPSLSLWFSERPELRFTTLQLADSTGTAVALGAITSVDGDAMGVTAPITAQLTVGRYTVSWRTAAADGHATQGKFSFIVTAAPALAATATALPLQNTTQSPPSLSPRKIPNAVIEPSQHTRFSTAMRWAELVAVLTLVGAMVFRLFVLREAGLRSDARADAVDRTKRLARAVLCLYALTTLSRLAAQSDLIPTAGTARLAAMVSVARDTGWGHGWLIGALGVIVVAGGLFLSGSITGWVAASLGVVLICLGEALTGHAGALARRASLATAIDVAHVLGAGGWLGGLVALLACGLPALRPLDASERRRNGRRLVHAYHHAAVECVALVLITAVIAAWLRLNALSELRSTEYGGLLLLKIGLTVILLGFGFYHWRSVVIPDWDEDTRFRFQRSAAGELVVGAIVLGATALLVATALPSA